MATYIFKVLLTCGSSGPNSCPDRGCDEGTLAMGWGSGTADFPYLVTVS